MGANSCTPALQRILVATRSRHLTSFHCPYCRFLVPCRPDRSAAIASLWRHWNGCPAPLLSPTNLEVASSLHAFGLPRRWFVSQSWPGTIDRKHFQLGPWDMPLGRSSSSQFDYHHPQGLPYAPRLVIRPNDRQESSLMMSAWSCPAIERRPAAICETSSMAADPGFVLARTQFSPALPVIPREAKLRRPTGSALRLTGLRPTPPGSSGDRRRVSSQRGGAPYQERPPCTTKLRSA